MNRFVTTCLQTCNSLCVFTCVYIAVWFFFAFNNFPATDKIDTFPVSAGDVIEEALREKPTCELADVKGKYVLSIPCTRENAQPAAGL